MAPQTPNTPPNTDEDEPLDPRLEAVAHKMRRLSLVSSGIMFVGVFAVLAVIIYRSASGPSSAGYPENLSADEVRTVVVQDMPGVTLGSVTADEVSVFVTADGPNGAVLFEIDRETWQIVSRIDFSNP